MRARPQAKLAIIGGSGLYQLAGLEDVTPVALDTPYGAPSDDVLVGTVGGKPTAFIARHGLDHRLMPGEVNYRANIYALKLLGVERILSASAVGSMREQVRPQDAVLVNQFIDRTQGRASTFFGDGVAAHVGFAEPICPELRQTLLEAATGVFPRAHAQGTYLCMEGPAFSTRAESELYRSWDVDVIGMTNLQEAKLSREAEICYATLALVTDYDCWHEDEEDVSVQSVLENLSANAKRAGKVLHQAIERLAEPREQCRCGSALAQAIITRPDAIGPEARERLAPIIGKYL